MKQRESTLEVLRRRLGQWKYEAQTNVNGMAEYSDVAIAVLEKLIAEKEEALEREQFAIWPCKYL